MYIYATFKTKTEAQDYLTSKFAEGEISPREVYGIIWRGRRYCIMLRGLSRD